MKVVFADTAFWIARSVPKDQWAASAQVATSKIVGARLVTTDFVLIEYLDSLAGSGAYVRQFAISTVREILGSRMVDVVEASRSAWQAAMQLYDRRGDKAYSLTDCASMLVMRARGIAEILTSDREFEQEGFTILMH
jgi:uncharacterized protein